MTRKDFIQQYAIAHAPLPEGRDPIDYAEFLWGRLEQRGYGHKVAEATTKKDWYKLLSDDGVERFDEFWKAFNKHGSRNRAALRWFQLEKKGINTEQLEQIVYAAKKETQNRLLLPTGQTPIHGEGWLSDFRYKEVKVPSKSVVIADEKRKERSEIIADISFYKQQHKLTDDALWLGEINKAEDRLKAL